MLSSTLRGWLDSGKREQRGENLSVDHNAIEGERTLKPSIKVGGETPHANWFSKPTSNKIDHNMEGDASSNNDRQPCSFTSGRTLYSKREWSLGQAPAAGLLNGGLLVEVKAERDK